MTTRTILSREWPGLSRVSFDRFQMGLDAAKMVTDQIQGQDSPLQMLARAIRSRQHCMGPAAFLKSFRLSEEFLPAVYFAFPNFSSTAP